MQHTAIFQTRAEGSAGLALPPLQQQPRRMADRRQQQQGRTEWQRGLSSQMGCAGRDDHPQRDTHGPSDPDQREHAGLTQMG